MANDPSGVLPGTLDLLILKAVSLGQLHGYGVLLRVQQMTQGALAVEQGALYPALYRLERQGLIRSEWKVTENNRRARYYVLTRSGRRQLEDELAQWRRLSRAVNLVLKATASN